VERVKIQKKIQKTFRGLKKSKKTTETSNSIGITDSKKKLLKPPIVLESQIVKKNC
jgi:hypothetical protein